MRLKSIASFWHHYQTWQSHQHFDHVWTKVFTRACLHAHITWIDPFYQLWSQLSNSIPTVLSVVRVIYTSSNETWNDSTYSPQSYSMTHSKRSYFRSWPCYAKMWLKLVNLITALQKEPNCTVTMWLQTEMSKLLREGQTPSFMAKTHQFNHSSSERAKLHSHHVTPDWDVKTSQRGSNSLFHGRDLLYHSWSSIDHPFQCIHCNSVFPWSFSDR